MKTDKELVKAAIAGDLQAFGELTERCRAGILIELTGLTGSVHNAEDAVQEAFLRSFLKLSTLKEPYNFGGWVRQIARNIARNQMRKPELVQLHEEFTAGSIEAHRDTSSAGVSALSALSALSPRLRETSRLAYLSNYPQKQVAELLGIPLGTVKRRLWESRNKMRKEVLNMSERTSEAACTAPEITVRNIPEAEMTVHATGPGLYFTTILKEGHEESCRFFDYPGGILTQTVHTRVVRKVNISGRKCFEVLIQHSNCEPPSPNVLQYFTKTKAGFDWVMMTTADEAYPRSRFMGKGEELFPGTYSSGETKDYSACTVDLSIGNTKYRRCLKVLWGWQNGTPAESFFTPEGRQVLHRRYAGRNAAQSSHFQYNNLPEEPALTFKEHEYRLWYDTILVETRPGE